MSKGRWVLQSITGGLVDGVPCADVVSHATVAASSIPAEACWDGGTGFEVVCSAQHLKLGEKIQGRSSGAALRTATAPARGPAGFQLLRGLLRGLRGSSCPPPVLTHWLQRCSLHLSPLSPSCRGAAFFPSLCSPRGPPSTAHGPAPTTSSRSLLGCPALVSLWHRGAAGLCSQTPPCSSPAPTPRHAAPVQRLFLLFPCLLPGKTNARCIWQP